MRALQRLIAYAAWDADDLDELDDEQRDDTIAASYQLVQALPPLSGALRTWTRATAQALTGIVRGLADPPAHAAGHLARARAAHADPQAAEVFTAPDADLAAVTVHGMKGEEAEAVMVVIHPPHASDPTTQLDLWERTVTGETVDTDREEERRVTFVALTRAQRCCLVAVPDTRRGIEMAHACEALGFALIS